MTGDTVDGANSPLNIINLDQMFSGSGLCVDLSTGNVTYAQGYSADVTLRNVAYLVGTFQADTLVGSARDEVFDTGNSFTGGDYVDGGLGRDVLVTSRGAGALVRNHDGSFSLDSAGGPYPAPLPVNLRHVEVLRTPDGDVSLLPHGKDFSGLGRDAVLWHHDNGAVWQWNLSGAAIGSGGGGQSPGADWALLGSGDLDGDGHADLLWRHAGDGQVWTWQMNGTAITGGGGIAAVDASWSVAAIADLTGDGRADILWHHAGDGALWLFAMNGTAIGAGSGGITNPGAPWALQAAADLDGDGTADLLWRNADTGEFYAWTMDGTAPTGMAGLGTPDAGGITDWALAGTGDFDGDGQADLLLRSAATGALLLWETRPDLSHAELWLPNPGTAWQIAALSDVNGDGFTDILWRHAATGQPYLWLMQDNAILAQAALPDPGSGWHVMA